MDDAMITIAAKAAHAHFLRGRTDRFVNSERRDAWDVAAEGVRDQFMGEMRAAFAALDRAGFDIRRK